MKENRLYADFALMAPVISVRPSIWNSVEDNETLAFRFGSHHFSFLADAMPSTIIPKLDDLSDLEQTPVSQEELQEDQENVPPPPDRRRLERLQENLQLFPPDRFTTVWWDNQCFYPLEDGEGIAKLTHEALHPHLKV